MITHVSTNDGVALYVPLEGWALRRPIAEASPNSLVRDRYAY